MTTKAESRAKWLRTKSPTRTKRRQCGRCGKIGYYAPGWKGCLQLVGLLGTYRCPGWLRAVQRKPKRTLQEGIKAMLAEPDAPGPSRADDLRRKAAQNMEHAAKRAADWQVRFNKNVGHLRRYGTKRWALRCAAAATEANKWARKVAYYQKRTEMTDAELAAEIERLLRALERKRKTRRAMTLKEGV